VEREGWIVENKTFQRNFLIFNIEETGYDTGQKLSGHVRVEVREGRGKLWTTIQNLNTMGGRLCYKLYMIRAGRGKVVTVCPGILDIKQNRAEMEWEFDPHNVQKSGLGLNDFELFAVLAENTDRENIKLICPLAAYKDKKVDWRSSVETLLYKQQKHIPEKRLEEDVLSKYPSRLESKYIPPETKPEFNSFDINSFINVQHPAIVGPNKYEDESLKKPAIQIQNEQFPEDIPVDSQGKFPENQEKYPDNQEEYHENEENVSAVNEEPPQKDEIPETYENKEPQTPYEAVNNEASKPDSKCLYMNGNMCGMYLSPSGINPCSTCTIHAQKATVQEDKRGDLSKLKIQLERNFEPSDPFHSKRSDYKWWKVSNPVNLNNILYQCNIRSPLLFNPMVMMAHFKYRHLVIGIFTDKVRNREYVVCGVPGMHMVDKRPFGELCRWVQAEGNRPKYGAFGYWIVYIDPGTGKILSLK
jgi:hypothetical protein